MMPIRLNHLRSILQQNTPLSKTETSLDSSAILILLREQNQQTEMVLTRRAFHLNNHPGQICFAGGRYEDSDKDLIQTAIREAHEEIGLPRDRVEILGSFRGIETISGFWMTPIVAYTDFQGDWCIDSKEVHSMLSIPLDWAMQKHRWRQENGYFRGQLRSYYCAWWQGQLIWGATAQVLNNMSQLVNR